MVTIIEALARNFTHCAHDIVAVATETPSDLPKLATEAFSRLTSNLKSQVAGLLNEYCKNESIQLSELYCLVTEYLKNKCLSKSQKHPNNTDYKVDYARALTKYAVTLYRIGRNDSALEPARESQKIFQRQALKNPDRFEPDYAMSLITYSNRLVNVGKYEDALETAKQAVEIYQRLALKNPDRFEPDYAMSLFNYANRMSNVGRYEDALETAKQAVEIYQRLALKNPDRFEPNYAISLFNYANRMSNVGRYEDALEPAKQSLEILQRLALKNPDRFEPDYALSLHNYASLLSNIGRYVETLEPAKKSLKIDQRLAQKNPARFSKNEFSSYYFMHFLDWLSDPANPIGELSAIPNEISSHHRQILLIDKTFVEACQANENLMARTEAFTALAAIYGDLSQENRLVVQNSWLCSAAWCAAFIPETIVNLNWESEWHQYVSRKQGNIPHWMNIVAQRLTFQFPE